VFGIAMSIAFDATLSDRLAALQLPAPLHDAVWEQRERLAAIVVPPDAADPARIQRAIGEAFVAGFRQVMLACAVLALLSALGSWLVIDGKREASDR